MTSLDTVKFSIPFSDITFNQAHGEWLHTPPKNKGGAEVTSDTWSCNTPLPGLKSILVEPGKDKVTYEVSAKILRDDYLNGINLKTIDQVIDTINNTGLTDIKSLSSAECYRIDTTQNIEWVKTKPIDLILALQVNSLNPGFDNIIYNSKTEKSINFKAKTKSVNSRLTCYYKYLELQLSKNKSFLEACNKPYKLIEKSESIMRLEQNTTALKEMRSRFDITDNNLMSILKSNTNTNYNLLKKITSVNNVEQLEFFERWKDQDITPGEIFTRIGKEGVIKSCNYDSKLIIAWLKSKTKYWDSYWYDRKSTKGTVKGLQSILREIRTVKGKQIDFYHQTFTDFLNLVKVA